MSADEEADDEAERENSMDMIVEALKVAGVFGALVVRKDDELIVQLRQSPQLNPEALATLLEVVGNAKPDEINSEGKGRVRFWWD